MTGVSFGIFFDNRYNGWVFAKLNLKTLQNEDPFMRVVYYSPLKTYTIPSVFYCCKTNNYGLSEYIILKPDILYSNEKKFIYIQKKWR